MSINIQQLKKTTGFTLLEVMISMVIFSVGMLGLAGIQAIALQNNNTAYCRILISCGMHGRQPPPALCRYTRMVQRFTCANSYAHVPG